MYPWLSTAPELTDFHDLHCRLKPLRIRHEPAAILKVIVENTDNAQADDLAGINVDSWIGVADDLHSSEALNHKHGSEHVTILAAESPSHPGLVVVDDSLEVSAPLDSQLLHVPSSSFVKVQPVETGLAVRSQFMDPEPRLRRHSFNGLQELSVQAIVSSQMMQTASIKEALSDRFDKMQVDLDRKNRVLQDQLVYMHERYEELQQRSHKELLLKQQEIIYMQQQMTSMQQQALDRLAIIQNRVQVALSQTYELHEYPIPRLFIILPKEKRKRDKIQRRFVKQFRLYFLCECGAHTKVEGSKISHDIHLANHEGYDIQKPDEFFEKYGSYVLTMLQMVKYGFIAAGIAVPILGHLKLIEAIDVVQDNLDFAQSTIGSLVDESITFVQGQTKDTSEGLKTKDASEGLKTTADQTELGKQEVLEGADLRQLQSYLSINDKNRVLGNLYRIVTLQGYVKWVCMEHHHDLYHHVAVNELRDIIVANRGSFVEEKGIVKVGFQSNILATQFYEAMTKSRCIQDLTITLDWEMTKDDIKYFSTAVTKANVVRLDLRGCGFGGLTDADSSQFRPLLELMANGRIQSMTLNCHNLQFLNTEVSTMKNATQLRELSLGIHAFSPQGKSKLLEIVENCRWLTSLTITVNYAHDVFLYVYHNLLLFRSLETIHVLDSRYHMTVGLSKGVIVKIITRIIRPKCWEDKSFQQFFLSGSLTKLHLNLDETCTSKVQYIDILQRNPELSEVSFQADILGCLEITEWTVSARQQLLARGQPIPSCQLIGYNITVDANISCTTQFNNRSSLFSQSIEIVLNRGARIDDGLRKLLHQYGRSITTLDITEADTIDMGTVAALLESSIRIAGSKLVSLKLSLAKASLADLECLSRVIAHSQSLKHLHFTFHLDCERLQEKAEWLLGRHGGNLTGLVLLGNGEASWAPEIVQRFPKRRDLPNLEIFEARNIDTTQNEEFFALWVADIISSPPQMSKRPAASPLSQPSLLSLSTLSVPESETWTHLKVVKIEGIALSNEQWGNVFKAINFTALEELEFKETEFSMEQFQAFIDSIPSPVDDSEEDLPLKKLYFHYQRGFSTSDDLKALMAQLKEKAPLVVMST
ncbi:hypothetical protein EDD21DRAFT_31329 [Dissophora ornata]|nr:hypothetical protein EDD21DRAFT_31329 [Dissophora ornata]